MIDVKELKTRYDEIAKNIKDRYMNVDLDKKELHFSWKSRTLEARETKQPRK